jgi:hypothetical protein
MPKRRKTLDLEEPVITVCAALDDALAEAGLATQDGKLAPRPGPPPEVDDREVLCLTVLQELLDFESDHGFYQWFETKPVMRRLSPRRLTRPDWADRRALLTPILQRLSQAFCALDGEAAPPFCSGSGAARSSVASACLTSSFTPGGRSAAAPAITRRVAGPRCCRMTCRVM